MADIRSVEVRIGRDRTHGAVYGGLIGALGWLIYSSNRPPKPRASFLDFSGLEDLVEASEAIGAGALIGWVIGFGDR